jgi:hypothetical protein
MSNQVFGEVDYNDDRGSNNKKNTNSKDLWLRLSDGPNKIRVLTSPFQYTTHKHKKDGDPGFGQKVGCTMIHGSCQLCEIPDNNPKDRWFYGVIDRKTGTYKIVDVSFAVFSKIRDLARDKDWGDPTKYDINILVKKGAPPNDYYNVIPLSKEPLSATDQQIKDKDVDLEDLKRRCTPLTLVEQQRRIDKINGVTSEPVKTSAKPAAKAVAKPVVKAAPVVEAAEESAELEEDFPPYDGAADTTVQG